MSQAVFVRRTAGSLLLAAALAAPAAAQLGPIAIGAKASTLGLGGEVAIHLAGPLAVRAGYTAYSFSETSEEEGISYDIKGDIHGTPLILDFHPFKGAFRLSAGMVFKTPRATLHATNSTSMTIGDRDYAPGEVGSLDGSIQGKKNAPFVGIGFDKAVFSKSRISFGFELGAVIIGTPEPVLTANSTLTGPAKTQLDADIASELQELKDGIADAPGGGKYYPFVGFSLKIRL